MLGVPTVAPATLHPASRGLGQRRFGEDAVDTALPTGAERRRIGGDALRDQRLVARVALDHLAGVGPEIVERRLGAAVALRGTVAQADQPFAGVAQVIGRLLLGLGGDRR